MKTSRSFSLRNLVVLLALVLVSILPSAASAHSSANPQHAPRTGASSPFNNDYSTLQQSARGRHPKWNAAYLTERNSDSKRHVVNNNRAAAAAAPVSPMKSVQRRGEHVPKTSGKSATLPPATVKNVQSLAVANGTALTCNGRSDICDLRYNQVTYPGTHNSATYNLKYDCEDTTKTCLQKKTVCTAQAQNCTKGWETRCTKMSNSCQERLPGWLHWLCGAFSSVCEATEQVCLGWEEICTSSLDVCTLWGSACGDIIPDAAIQCLWENQPDHLVSKQLTDGIRFLDLGVCMVQNNTQTLMCHGSGATRAVGDTLDSVMGQIRDFMNANPNEVVTVEFNEYDGDAGLVGKAVVSKVLQYFTKPTGEPMYWTRSNVTEPWPTLRQMIQSDKRIMLFLSDFYYSIPDPKPAWANEKDVWKLDGFRYTNNDTQPAQLNQSYYNWCTQGPPTDGSFVQWQQMDINLGILKDDIINSIKKGQIPQLCIGPLAQQTNGAMLNQMADFCYTRWPYWFRVRVNDYWEGNVLQVVNSFNDRNVARVKAGETLTPY